MTTNTRISRLILAAAFGAALLGTGVASAAGKDAWRGTKVDNGEFMKEIGVGQ